jgi:hypothetical protein
MAKIFVRERGNVREGDGQPRFAVVGVHETDMKFFKTHLRKGELDAIAQAVGAELVTLPRGQGEHVGDEGGGGQRHGRRRHGGEGRGRHAASS